MRARGAPRVAVQGSITFSGDEMVGQGLVTNLSLSGCVVESDHTLRRGDYVALRLHVPGDDSPLETELAAVRWARGRKFGVEFIRASKKTQSQLRRLTMAAFVRVPGKQ